MDEELFFVEAEESGERIDALLARMIPDLSRSAAQKLLEQDAVCKNEQPVRKNYKVSKGDHFTIQLPEPTPSELLAQDIPLDICYEDNSVIVINKPRGMVVHPAPGHPDKTLVNALLYHCGDSLSGIGGEKRPGIVHRIDKDTSGLLIVAKNDKAHQFLSDQLADRSLSRDYLAVACGAFHDESGLIDRPIGRNPNDRKKMAVTEVHSRAAQTLWSVERRYQNYTLVRCKLKTGRTHQIRVHMASIGHPLLGDGLYGARCPDKGLEGQCLHAYQLQFIHPDTLKKIVLEAPIPTYFNEVLARLGTPIN